MASRRALVVLIAAALAAAVDAGVIPSMMFASHPSGKAFGGQRQALSGPRHWQRLSPPGYNPWNDGSETYGYVAERHPSSGVVDDLTAVLQRQQQQQQMPLVYGVPHRYIGDADYAMPGSDDENPLLFARPFGVLKRSALSPAAIASYYDLVDSADAADDAEDGAADDYEPPISRQDVLNFEKYVQRYFQQPDAARLDEYNDDWSTAGLSGDDSYDAQNDEEAARQLHLLLRQPSRRPAIATREISKKSVKVAVKSTSAPTSTTTSTTTQAPSTYGQPVHYKGHQQGQKEEAMLRPPTPQRPASSPAPAIASDGKADASVYHTIQRLMYNPAREPVIDLLSCIRFAGLTRAYCLGAREGGR